jgi:hypothetical protein
MARAALDRSAGRCESFTGHADADVLVRIAHRHVHTYLLLRIPMDGAASILSS